MLVDGIRVALDSIDGSFVNLGDPVQGFRTLLEAEAAGDIADGAYVSWVVEANFTGSPIPAANDREGGKGVWDKDNNRIARGTLWSTNAENAPITVTGNAHVIITPLAVDFRRAVINVKDFGAVGDGEIDLFGNIIEPGTDNTEAMLAAVTYAKSLTPMANVYAPSGIYNFTEMMALGATNGSLFEGMQLYGDGKYSTIFLVTSEFNMASEAIVSLGRGCAIRDIGFIFDADTDDTRETFTQYPPAVAAHHNEPTIERLLICRAWIGIDMTDKLGNNPERFFVNDVECSALDIGLALNHLTDWGHIKSFHFKGFGFPGHGTPLGDAARDGTTRALDAWAPLGGTPTDDAGYMVQGLKVTDLVSLWGIVRLGGSASFGALVSLDLDAVASLEVEGGAWKISNMVASGAKNAGVFTGGSVTIDGFHFNLDLTENDDPFVSVTDANVSFQNGFVGNGPEDEEMFRLEAGEPNDGFLRINNVYFAQSNHNNFTKPIIHQVKGKISIVNNRFAQKGTGGSGTIVVIDTNDTHIVTGNIYNSWDVTYPENQNAGWYSGNQGSGAGINGKEFYLRDETAAKVYVGYTEGEEVYFGAAGDKYVHFYDNDAWTGGFYRGAMRLPDGVTARSAESGVAQIFVDVADGDLKVIFGDGTTKTIATDT